MIGRGRDKIVNTASVQTALARTGIAPYTATTGACGPDGADRRMAAMALAGAWRRGLATLSEPMVGSGHSIFPKGILHGDLAVPECEDVAAIRLDRTGRSRRGEEPFRDAAITCDEVARVVPPGIGKVPEEGLDPAAGLLLP